MDRGQLAPKQKCFWQSLNPFIGTLKPPSNGPLYGDWYTGR